MDNTNYNDYYSDYWKKLGTVLIYHHPNFQFYNDVIIVELDDCLIKNITQTKLYNTMNVSNIELYSDEFSKKLQKESVSKSIVVISNQVNKNRIITDFIKRKVEEITQILNIPLLCIFAIQPNCFMKPHTGCWRLLNTYYRKYGNTQIYKAMVVSDEGGLINEYEKKGVIIKRVCSSDIDRAFAWNTKLPYYSIDEYLNDEQNYPYKWDGKIISPEVRSLYVQHIKTLTNPKILQTIKSFGNRDAYVIMIMGAPRSGKTRLAKKLITKWNKDIIGEDHAIERLGLDEYSKISRFRQFKKLINGRFSVIIDGSCHNDELREPYIEYLRGRNIPILCIEINCGIQMAKVFNHAYVEEANSDQTVIYKSADYNIYKAEHGRPIESKNLKYILYTPQIEERPAVMLYRY